MRDHFPYTPTTDIVRERYATYTTQGFLTETALAVHGPEFDRWLLQFERDKINEISERIRKLLDAEWEETQDVDTPRYVALLEALDAVDPGQTKLEAWGA